MPTVRTRTLNRFHRGNLKLSRDKSVPVSYAEGVALRDDDRFIVEFTDEEHANHYAAKAAGKVPSKAKTTKATQAADAPEEVADLEEVDPEDEVERDEVTGEPTDPAYREDTILEAFGELDLDNPDHFTKAGLPDARVLSGLVGWTVTAGERDRIFVKPDPKPAAPTNLRISRKATEPDPIDTGAAMAVDEDDPTTEGSVKV